MSDQNKGSSQSQPVSAPESAARNSSAPMDMSKTTTPDLAAILADLAKEAREELDAHREWLIEHDEEPDPGCDWIQVHPDTLVAIADAYAEKGRKLEAAEASAREQFATARHNADACADLTAKNGRLSEAVQSYRQSAEGDRATIAALKAEVERLKGQASQASTLIRVAMNTEDADAKAALIHAALDFASDDTEALAEGAKWAPVDPALTTQGEG